MILGVGTDLCDIRRIEATLQRFGDRFVDRIFTRDERARAERRPATRAYRYAQTFAAKEACAKALGTGLRLGVFWRDMQVVHLPSGKPTLQLMGGALQRLMFLVPSQHQPVMNVSLTDEFPLAHAIVIISAVGSADVTLTHR